MTRARSTFAELTADCDMDIDDPEERALNILRRTRANPQHSPDEPAPLTLKPWDAEPGDEKCAVKYTYRNELTTVGEVIEDVAKMTGEMPCDVTLVHGGRRLGPPELTLTDCNVFASYIVYWRIEKKCVFVK